MGCLGKMESLSQQQFNDTVEKTCVCNVQSRIPFLCVGVITLPCMIPKSNGK